MSDKKNLVPCLWFDAQAEEAANLYVSIFKNSRITEVSRYTEAGQEVHGGKPGSVLTMSFELDGRPFMALNGGPAFQFNEAVSFVIYCETQEEIDDYWEKLLQGGGREQQCGWVKDKFGLSWQVVPTSLGEMMKDSDPAKSGRAMQAMLQMKKLDIAELKRAYEG